MTLESLHQKSVLIISESDLSRVGIQLISQYRNHLKKCSLCLLTNVLVLLISLSACIRFKNVGSEYFYTYDFKFFSTCHSPGTCLIQALCNAFSPSTTCSSIVKNMVDCFKSTHSLQCGTEIKPFDFGKKFKEQCSVLKKDVELKRAYQAFKTKNSGIVQRIENSSMNSPIRKHDAQSSPDVDSSCDKLEIRQQVWQRRDSFSSCSSDSAVYCSSRHTQVNTSTPEPQNKSSNPCSLNHMDKRHRHSSDSSIVSNSSDVSSKETHIPSVTDIFSSLQCPSTTCTKESYSETSKNVTVVSELNTQSTISFSPTKTTDKATVETIVELQTVSYTCDTVKAPSFIEPHHNLRQRILKPSCKCCGSPHPSLIHRRFTTTTTHTSSVQNPSQKASTSKRKRYSQSDDFSSSSSQNCNKKRRSEVTRLYDALHEIKWAKHFSPDNILSQIDFRRAASFSVYSKSTQMQQKAQVRELDTEKTSSLKPSCVSENHTTNNRKLRGKHLKRDGHGKKFTTFVNSNAHNVTVKRSNNRTSSKSKQFTKNVSPSNSDSANQRQNRSTRRRKANSEIHKSLNFHSSVKCNVQKPSSIGIGSDKTPAPVSDKSNVSGFESSCADTKIREQRHKIFSDFNCAQTISENSKRIQKIISLTKSQDYDLTSKSKLNETSESSEVSFINDESADTLLDSSDINLDDSQSTTTDDGLNSATTVLVEDSCILPPTVDSSNEISPALSLVCIENDDALLLSPTVDSNSGNVIATYETMVIAEPCNVEGGRESVLESDNKNVPYADFLHTDNIPDFEEESVFSIDLLNQNNAENYPSIGLETISKDNQELECADDSLEIPILTENCPIEDCSSDENPPLLEPCVTVYPNDSAEMHMMVDNGLSEVEIIIPNEAVDDTLEHNYSCLVGNTSQTQLNFSSALETSSNTLAYSKIENHLKLENQNYNRFEQEFKSTTIVPKTSSPKKIRHMSDMSECVKNNATYSKSRSQIVGKMIWKKYFKVMCRNNKFKQVINDVSSKSFCTDAENCEEIEEEFEICNVNSRTDSICVVDSADNSAAKFTSSSCDSQVDSDHESVSIMDCKDSDRSASSNNQQICGSRKLLNFVKRKEQISHETVHVTTVRTANSSSACITDSSCREIHHINYNTSCDLVSKSEPEKSKLELHRKEVLPIESAKKPDVGEDILRMSFGFTFHYKGITVNRNDSYTQVILKLTRGQNIFLSVEALAEFKDTLTSAANDPNCQVVIVNGVGNTFCSGLDFKPLLGPRKTLASKEMAVAVKEFVEALAAFHKPLVAVVNGSAVGLGVTLLTYSDAVLASDSATFHMPYTQLACMPEGGAVLTLPQVVGSTVAMDMLLRGRVLSASQAYDYGLVTEVLKASLLPQQLVSRVRILAENRLSAMETTKALLRMHVYQKLNYALESELSMLPKQWLSQTCQAALKEAFQTGLFGN